MVGTRRIPADRTRRWMLLAVLLWSFNGCGEDNPKSPSLTGGPAPARWFLTGQLDLRLWNDGSWLSHPPPEPRDEGFLFTPQSIVLFDHGLWIGAMIQGETRVTATSFFGTEVRPLALEDGRPAQVYRLDPGDGPGAPDYDQWPRDAGAPTDTAGRPRVLGARTAWTAHDDLDPQRHTRMHSAPLGAEIRQTVWVQTGFETVLFIRFEVRNVSDETWEEAFLGLFSDPDIGSAHNDRVACDIDRSLGYAYTNPNEPEPFFGGRQPAAGVLLLATPQDRGFFAFSRLPKVRDEPESAVDAYALLQGLAPRGDAVIDSSTGEPTRYYSSGDPVNGTGFTESGTTDKRMFSSTGPFSVPPGEAVELTYAIVYAAHDNALDAVTELRRVADEVIARPDLWESL